MLTLIAALAEDRVIGSASGGIPWDLPRDRAHFRARTEGRWLLVGRRTYAEMEGWFGDRTPIILTKQPDFRPRHPAHRVVASPAAALDLARANGVGELIVCGGAEVYAATLPLAGCLVLTRIGLHVDIPDPVRFPDFESSGEWRLSHTETWPAADGGPAARCEIHARKPQGGMAKSSLARGPLPG